MSTYTRNGRKLLYVPIDIEVDLPPEEELRKFHSEHRIRDVDYHDIVTWRHAYTMVASKYPIDDWKAFPWDFYQNKQMWKDFSEEYNETKWCPAFVDAFPKLVDAIKQLPFKQLSFVGWMAQFGPYAPHVDSPDENDPTEPRRYNILLTDSKHNTFYFWDGENKIPQPTVDPKYPIFAFNNSDVKHATNPVTGFKIAVGIMGVIDEEKHVALIERSLTKFPDKAVWL
jgi:hypothetical protein